MRFRLATGFLSLLFVTHVAAQQPEHPPEHHPGTPETATEKPMMHQQHMMDQHQQMQAEHRAIQSSVDELLKSFASLENEKDAAVLKTKLSEHQALLTKLQGQLRQSSEKMAAKMKNMGDMKQMGEMCQSMKMGQATAMDRQPMMMGQRPMTGQRPMMQQQRQARQGGMPFSQAKNTHHFFLTKEGGVIHVEANDPQDTTSRDAVRSHLEHISHAFSAGDFSDPLAVHGKPPDGVPALQRLKGEITYRFEETPQGGRVVIQTKNPEALEAIHQFLRFQVKDHNTGDSTEVQ